MKLSFLYGWNILVFFGSMGVSLKMNLMLLKSTTMDAELYRSIASITLERGTISLLSGESVLIATSVIHSLTQHG